ncbi:hypothetical protein [Clostridium hydrogeniformans]|uniref:hypothetical protein n=1 Tax=Clostridium hydrogeniformans TaxID=349933 RepID=UPI000484B324|nr:hypothetical protein [Clostridium hydrogeniformans]
MSDIKTTTMRLSEDTIKSFRKIAENEGFTQEQCLSYLVNVFEMQNAKEVMGDRKKEIETFEDYVNKLISLFMNSLDISINAEEKIKDKYIKESKDKDSVILRLTEEIMALKEDSKKKDKEIKAINTDKEKTLKDFETKEELLKQNKAYIEKLEEEKETLNKAIKENVSHKEEKEALEEEIKTLLEKITDLNLFIRKKELKIESLESQLELHKENYNELKEELKNERIAFENKIKENSLEYSTKLQEERKRIETESENNFNKRLSLEIERVNIEKEKYILALEKQAKEENDKKNNKKNQ